MLIMTMLQYDYSDEGSVSEYDDNYISTRPQQISQLHVTAPNQTSEPRKLQIGLKKLENGVFENEESTSESDYDYSTTPPPAQQRQITEAHSRSQVQHICHQGSKPKHKCSNRLKDKLENDEYVNLCLVLQRKHEECGRRIKENDVFKSKEMNELCRYCLVEIYKKNMKKNVYLFQNGLNKDIMRQLVHIKNYLQEKCLMVIHIHLNQLIIIEKWCNLIVFVPIIIALVTLAHGHLIND